MIQLSSYTKFLWAGDYGLKNILQDGRIEIYSGVQPADADQATTGTLLGLVTQDGLTFTPNSRAAGALQIEQSGYGVLKHSGHWRLRVSTSGTAGWFRYHGNYADSNLEDTSKVHIRLDGTVATDGDLRLNPTLTAGDILPVHFYLQFRNL